MQLFSFRCLIIIKYCSLYYLFLSPVSERRLFCRLLEVSIQPVILYESCLQGVSSCLNFIRKRNFKYLLRSKCIFCRSFNVLQKATLAKHLNGLLWQRVDIAFISIRPAWALQCLLWTGMLLKYKQEGLDLRNFWPTLCHHVRTIRYS